MKITCDIIGDLLPLYEDEVCSEDSKKAVEEHLKTCSSCAAYYKKIKAPFQEVVHEEQEKEENEEYQTEAKAIKQSFKKVKYYWIKWIFVSCIVISLVGLVVFKCVSLGITPDNWQAIKKAEQYMLLLKDGAYEEAADCMSNYYIDYQEIIKQEYSVGKELLESEEESFSLEESEIYAKCYYYELNLSQEEYVEYRKESFVEMMENYSSRADITEFTFKNAQHNNEIWSYDGKIYHGTEVTFAIKEKFEGDEQEYLGEITIFVQEDSVRISTANTADADKAGHEGESIFAYVSSTIRGMYGRYFGIGLWREETER